MSNLFIKCPSCGTTHFSNILAKSLFVCPECAFHHKLDAPSRLKYTIDKGTFEEFDKKMRSLDPLSFPEYEEKLKIAHKQTGQNSAVVSGKAKIGGLDTVIVVMDTRFIMASMGSVVGEKITRAFEYATAHKLPIVIFTASGGARMQEGIYSLMQMAKTSAAAKRHANAGLLYISVLTHPTTGGVTASFAYLADIILAEPKALIGFAGPRVIEQTINQKLPEGFQKAEFLLEHGMLDKIVSRDLMKDTLINLIKLHSTSFGLSDKKYRIEQYGLK
ncbi:MAG: acetyl-CoA carboxylase subunit beta [Spirochaetes bacterium GWF1_31_7]|nr:MAG: acetyl-CoA carboxylase subunit beta [Spirochaetes bacterium GWE1_32_154]OHD46241.1 MAG: acetyl-CoA carboxylase subunit beta [Spirochaetes bacterium GWE2_31_10]OHD48611.1 MAG: acetyl-CoA carboxylase subunit beta [Spirochaetes bacterium GWF1_31_7]HBD93058.1 acetyl-CoA carboxylase carboxyl transferase subunit beta [Spirochaetia bacterium]HBI39204.1 acetyl-CoA carboxylase carboxyl transferase subunit beta [Spirochaetia bacterium]